MNLIYEQIIKHISQVYDKHEEKVRRMNQEKRAESKDKKKGLTPQQQKFFETCAKLEQPLYNLKEKMSKSTVLNSNAEMKNYIDFVANTAEIVELINRNKVLKVKANELIVRLSERTSTLVPKLSDCLDDVEKEAKCCCYWWKSKYSKIFHILMAKFREHASNWTFLWEVEPKDMSENYVSQPFKESEFEAIGDILLKNWQQNSQVIEKIVKVEVPKKVIQYRDNQKPNRLIMAHELIYGINREMHPTLGIKIYTEEADMNGNPSACNMLGQIYELGEILPQDFQKALQYYKKSYNFKDPYGTYLYARAHEKGLKQKSGKASDKDLKTAFELYIQAAEDNCPDACVELGDIYERGSFDFPNENALYIFKDLKKSIQYYKKAIGLGSPKALNNLGVMYLKNKTMDDQNPNNEIKTETNVKKNEKIGLTMLREAVDTGFPMAFFNLGSLYEKGEIVNKNINKAKQLFFTGASRGCDKSKNAYAFCLINQTSIYKESFQDEYRVAIKWLEEVAAKIGKITKMPKMDRQEDSAKALYYLGLYYEYGFGVGKRPQKAVDYFEKSASLEDPDAMNKLGDCYYSGFGVQLDQQVALGCYKQAAQKNNGQALINLGSAYYHGVHQILEKDDSLAYDYFKKAMEAGNTDACVHLSQMYEKGIFVDQDDDLANDLLVMGASKKNQTAIYMLNQRG